jgi:deazaflavin-dependent oxidoreductase (nitroreductase family)
MENIPYPTHPMFKAFFKTPLLLWRLGLGRFVGKIFLVLTTRGRRTGRPRHTMVEFHIHRGRKFVVAAWPQSDWYRNLQSDPVVTIQTAAGTETVRARRLVEAEELGDVFDFLDKNPLLRRFWQFVGLDLSTENVLKRKEDYHILTFDPTGETGPPPLDVDLPWVLPVVLLSAIAGGIGGFLLGRRKTRMETGAFRVGSQNDR